jgi:hypothetical protein
MLGIANMRLGEYENCQLGHSHESCIAPIRGKGIHTKKRGAEGAVQVYTRELELNPDQDGIKWLLNIAHMQLGTWPQKVPIFALVPEKAFESQVRVISVTMNV